MRRIALILVLLMAGCTTPWQRHIEQLQEARANHDFETALIKQRWLIDHSLDAPAAEQGPRNDARRYLELADLAAQVKDMGEAINALRSALQVDPSRYDTIMQRLDRLPLAAADRRRVEAEFRWNIQVLEPGSRVVDERLLPCWSYRAHEIHIRTNEVHRGLGKSQRRITYDARTWIYDSGTQAWYPDGDWVPNIGEETELVDGPPDPRYRAFAAADGGFITNGPVPPCHGQSWTGPFDTERQELFVAPHLPGTVR
jgi:hypothetical protein